MSLRRGIAYRHKTIRQCLEAHVHSLDRTPDMPHCQLRVLNRIHSAVEIDKQARWRLFFLVLHEDPTQVYTHCIYGELAYGARRIGRPALRFRDAWKRDIKSPQISIESWESAAADRKNWRQAVRSGVRKAEERRNELWTEKREHRRERPLTTTPLHQTVYTCTVCNRDCH